MVIELTVHAKNKHFYFASSYPISYCFKTVFLRILTHLHGDDDGVKYFKTLRLG